MVPKYLSNLSRRTLNDKERFKCREMALIMQLLKGTYTLLDCLSGKCYNVPHNVLSATVFISYMCMHARLRNKYNHLKELFHNRVSDQNFGEHCLVPETTENNLFSSGENIFPNVVAYFKVHDFYTRLTATYYSSAIKI